MSNQTLLMLTTDRQIDRRTLQQADSLEKLGWVVTILAMPADHQAEDARVIRIRGKKVGLNVFSLLSCYRKIRAYVPMNGWLIQGLRHLLWIYIHHPENFYDNIFAHQIKEYTPNVVMAIDLPMLSVAAKHAKRCGAKLVYDSHELYSEQEFSKREKRQWQTMEATFIRQCDAVITVNPSIAAELKRRYDLQKVHVIYNAINSNPLIQKNNLFHRAFGLSSERKILLFQGGLSKGRYLETLVHAMIHVTHPHIDLVILGDGQLSQTLKRQVRSLGIQHRVYFHAAVAQHQLLEYTQSADAGIIPYQATCLNNYYCTPNKLFEFIAAGIPILASPLPEINDIVLKYQLGMTANMDHATSLALSIDTLFADEKQLETWRQRCLLAQQKFSWRHEETKLSELFGEICG